MINVIMVGCNGKMGQVISDIIKNDADAVMAAGVDVYDDGHNDYPVYAKLNQVQ